MPKETGRKGGPLGPLLAGIVAALMSVAFFAWLDHVQHEQFRTLERTRAVVQLANLRAEMEKLLNQHLGALTTIEASILSHEVLTEPEFHLIGNMLRVENTAIREVQLSPGGIIRWVTPPGNSETIGLDLRDDLSPEQIRIVKDTIRDRRMTISGPTELVQGGMALIARKPVYTRSESGSPDFWGFVTVVLDFPELLDLLERRHPFRDLPIAIRVRGGSGAPGQVIYGEPGLFDREDIVSQDISLPSTQSWILAIAPNRRVHGFFAQNFSFHVTAILFTATFGWLAWFAVRRRQLTQEALVSDYLTGLLNRQAFEQFANIEFEQAFRYQRDLTLMMIDIDHFKSINDRFGHAAGDSVLRETCVVMADALRKSDILGRLGGEEFAALLTETDIAAAQELAERLRRNIEQHAFTHQGETFHVTVSIGLAGLSHHIGHLDAFVQAADRAMYSAKQNGRNRVFTAARSS